MDKDDFEEMAIRWPDLFQKSRQQGHLGVGKGWHTIIDVLCRLLSQDIEYAKRSLHHAITHTGNTKASIQSLEAAVETARNELPIIDDIKEKFGTLRVYVSNGNDRSYNYISFAEAMSGHTCEVCGKPGKLRTGSWMKTLCDEHSSARDRGEDIWSSNNSESNY